MHFFLQGERRVGKSTVIKKTLDILGEKGSFLLGGFFTWNGGKDDPHVYMKKAATGSTGEALRLASWDEGKGRLTCDITVFERFGADLLGDIGEARLIIMDELGYLESGAVRFRKAVLDAVAGSVPILGVMRLGDVPWHEEIKSDPSVSIFDVNEENRDGLPAVLAKLLMTRILRD